MSLMSRLLFHINKHLQSWGYAVSTVQTPTVETLERFLKAYSIANIIDIGANGGQYGQELRLAGYAGEIISCEPLAQPFSKLAQKAAADSRWHCLNVALSDHVGTLDLHVSQATEFSSALPVLEDTIARDSNARVLSVETVSSRTLDDLWNELPLASGQTMLKIDTQGSEQAILTGAHASLSKIAAVQLELSAVPIYQGQPVMETMIERLRTLGFIPYMIWPGFRDSATGRALEYDGLFVRA